MFINFSAKKLFWSHYWDQFWWLTILLLDLDSFVKLCLSVPTVCQWKVIKKEEKEKETWRRKCGTNRKTNGRKERRDRFAFQEEEEKEKEEESNRRCLITTKGEQLFPVDFLERLLQYSVLTSSIS